LGILQEAVQGTVWIGEAKETGQQLMRFLIIPMSAAWRNP